MPVVEESDGAIGSSKRSELEIREMVIREQDS